jgi:hypothetical protein
MYVLIGMGEESQNIEIPCMFFDTMLFFKEIIEGGIIRCI